MQDAAEFVSQGREARHENRLADARAQYTEAARIYRDDSKPLDYAHAIRHVADMHLGESELAAAKSLYEESLEIYRSSLDTKLLDLANTVRPYALLNEKLGEVETAAQLWQEAKSLYSSLRIEAGIAECENHLAKLRA